MANYEKVFNQMKASKLANAQLKLKFENVLQKKEREKKDQNCK